MIDKGLTPRFAALFAGRTDVVGIGKGTVERRKITPRAYADHLLGLVGADLGIYPVRDDNTVLFSAIDIDEPNFELAVNLASLAPGESWVAESRSGNYHVYQFYDRPLPAWAARKVLRTWCLVEGRPDLEIFPKQDELKPGMIGNYISIPMFGETRPILHRSGDEPSSTRPGYSLSGFLDDAEQCLNNAEEWERRAEALGGRQRKPEGDEVFGERNNLHMCAEHIYINRSKNPIAVGHRHTVLFNVAKMYANCRHYSELDVLEVVGEINLNSEAPVSDSDVHRMVGNAFRGEFTSTGCDDPLMSPYVSPSCGIAHGS